VRAPAPPYANEGPHALWHVSENPGIRRFEPHVSATAAEREPLVWAIDTRHLPLYWFPRDCPRGTFWADAETTPADAARLLGESSRVHVIEESWLKRVRAATVFAYRLPEDRFEQHPDVGGYWISRAAVEPIEIETLDDLVGRHERAAIELRVLSNLWPLWNDVVASTLEFSGMRLRNAEPMLQP
jgi:hypothetical protein